MVGIGLTMVPIELFTILMAFFTLLAMAIDKESKRETKLKASY